MTIWIDAMCIDQSSPQDKAQQIPNMAHIYGRAEKVILWLGPDHEYSSTCDLQTFSSANISDRALEPTNPMWKTSWSLLRLLIYQVTKELYWERTWIIQELGMAKEITFHIR